MQKSIFSFQKLYIKKRTLPEWLVFFLLFMPFSFGLLIDLLGIPTYVRFALDVALMGLLIILFSRAQNRIKRVIVPLVVYFSLLSIYMVANYIINYQSILYFIWGYRNSFRFFFAFLVFVTFIDFEEAEQYLKYFDVLFWVNFVLCLIQFYFMGYKQDYLGGLFGVSVGCNGYLNIFLCIINARALIYFLDKRTSLLSVLLKLLASSFIAALAELKFFFVEVVFMLCVIFLITKFSWKKVGIVAIGIFGVVIGISVLTTIFPEYVGQFTIELLYESASSEKGYTSSGDINRLSAISTISNEMFNKWYHYFIGFGLGNCDLSSISVFNTPFYENHQDVNYNWFSHAFMYLETGYIGLLLFFGLFILFFILARKHYKESYTDSNFCQLAMTVSLLCFLFSIYNSTLRSDAVYMVSFVLALPFIKKESAQTSPLIG